MVGAFIEFGGSLFIVRTDGGFLHRCFGIGIRPPEALTVRLLRVTPFDLGHIREFDDGHFAAVGAAEDHIAQPAMQTLQHGVEGYFCHILFLVSAHYTGAACYILCLSYVYPVYMLLLGGL